MAPKIILSINSGSSSVKISIYKCSSNQSPQQIAELQVDGLTAPPPKLKYTRGSEKVVNGEKLDQEIPDQDAAFKYMLNHIVSDKSLTEITKKEDIALTVHRVVHGGDYSKPKIINRETYEHLERLTDLAPLHNGPALHIMKSCVQVLPEARNIAYFDSQFHHTIPEQIKTYPIDPEIAKKNGLRKYGFHGVSYAFITRSVAEFLGKKESETSIIALHLGSGASACAVRNGKSHNTSMGLTPVSGLPGATRSGNVDPSLVFHYATNPGKLSPNSTNELHITQAEELLNKQSGWKSLTGTTNFAEIASDPPKSEKHKLAFDIFVDRIAGFVGSYYVSLGGKVDALVFAGGIGEKSSLLRKRVTEMVGCLGFEIDKAKNEKVAGKEKVEEIGKEGVKHKNLVVATDEQFEMARGVTADEELFG